MTISIKRWVCAGTLHTRLELYTQGNRRSLGAIVLCKRHTGRSVDCRRHVYILF